MEHSLCGFRLGETTYAIPLGRVQECLQSCDVTPIPRSPNHIKGLTHYRGKMVVAIDVRALLDAKSIPVGNTMSIVVQSKDSFCCLEVDEVVDVIDIKDKSSSRGPRKHW